MRSSICSAANRFEDKLAVIYKVEVIPFPTLLIAAYRNSIRNLT